MCLYREEEVRTLKQEIQVDSLLQLELFYLQLITKAMLLSVIWKPRLFIYGKRSIR